MGNAISWRIWLHWIAFWKCGHRKDRKEKVKDSKGNNIDLTTKLFDEIAPKYEGRVGGYTRILKIGQRRGDAAEIVRLELI